MRLNSSNVRRPKFLGVFVDLLILLRFRPQKIIINRKGLLKEGYTKEEFRLDVIKRLVLLMGSEERDIEGVLDRAGIEFELFDYEFKLESLLN